MIATLGFGCTRDQDRRSIPKLEIWLVPDGVPLPTLAVELARSEGSDDNLQGILRTLFRIFFEDLPEQERRQTLKLDIILECHSPMNPNFENQMLGQLKDANHITRPCQKELHLKFPQFKTNIVVFVHLQ